MNKYFRIAAQAKEEVICTPDIPPAFKSYTLPGAKNMYASGDFGSAVFCEIKCPGVDIHYNNFLMRRTTCFYSRSDAEILVLHIVSKNNVYYDFAGVGEMVIREGQFNISYAPFLESRACFQKNELYSTVDVHFSLSFLQQLGLFYPSMDPFLKKIRKGSPGMISRLHPIMNHDMIMGVRDILQFDHFDEIVRNLFLNAKVTELLLQALDRLDEARIYLKDIFLKPYDVEKILEARNYLLLHLDVEHTIDELARRVGLNDFKLKKGFKQLYGTSVFDFLLEARMQKARLLIAESDLPIDKIALLTGYKNLPNFIAAFRAKIGVSPGSLRKKRNKSI